jgi:hypothetical protein
VLAMSQGLIVTASHGVLSVGRTKAGLELSRSCHGEDAGYALVVALQQVVASQLGMRLVLCMTWLAEVGGRLQLAGMQAVTRTHVQVGNLIMKNTCSSCCDRTW